jgi:protein-disulfide isomerase
MDSGAARHTLWLALPVAALAIGAIVAGGRAPREAAAAPLPAPAPQEVIDLRALGYSRGQADAPVVVIEFSDFGCPYCGQFFREIYPVLEREYVAAGKVRWKYVPVVLGIFPNGKEAARAAECAAIQGTDAFWAMHDRLYAQQSQWRSRSSTGAIFEVFADSLGLDLQDFGTCYRENRVLARMRQTERSASSLGVRATPTFLVNGTRIEGALPLAQFRMVIDLELAAARAGGR